MVHVWVESLPEQCPPSDSIEPNGVYYRMVDTFPPQESDFYSSKKEGVNLRFKIDECVYRSCSVFSRFDSCVKMLKLPRHKKKIVVSVSLQPNSGLIKHTCRDEYHFSWWRSASFVIKGNVTKIEK